MGEIQSISLKKFFILFIVYYQIKNKDMFIKEKNLERRFKLFRNF